MALATIHVQHLNVPPLVKTFTSEYEDNIIIAEDLASRMALHFIQAYYIGDDRVTMYVNTHIINHTKKAWKMVTEGQPHQLDVARGTIRHLHDKLYQSRLNFSNLSNNMRHSHMFETLKNNAHFIELTNETIKQQCQITMLENRLHYLKNMNVMLCTTHLHLLQLLRPNETSASTNSVQATDHENKGQNVPLIHHLAPILPRFEV